MPPELVKSISKNTGVDFLEAEKRWKKAKAITERESGMTESDGEDYWKYVTGVFKKSMGIGKDDKIHEAAGGQQSIKEWLNKFRKAKTLDQKEALWYQFSDAGGDDNKLLQEMILSLPAGSYKLHGHEYGTNITDKVFELYGKYPSFSLREPLFLGLAAIKPNKVHATFTHDMDKIEIFEAAGEGDRPKTICVDFDGVIADYEKGYQGPDVFGDPLPEAADVMGWLKGKGWKVIIFTTRPDTPALRKYLKDSAIPYDEINKNTMQPEGANPGKPIADLYLDDRAFRFRGWLDFQYALRDMEKKGILESATAEEIHAAAHEAATSHLNDLPQPTQAQKEAGTYKLGHVTIHGLDISIENPKGSTRSGTAPDGTVWSSTMTAHYGYFKRTVDNTGEHIDVFIGDHPESENVFIVDQISPESGRFDEYKVVLGARTLDEAKALYLSNYDSCWQGLGAITGMTLEKFKEWIAGETLKPVNDSIMEAADELDTGDFGPILRQFVGKPKEAIAELTKLKNGEALSALYHPEIGYIDLVWGVPGTGHSDGYGLSKIIRYHPEVVHDLQGILKDMMVVKKSQNRIQLESDDFKAAVRLSWNGKKKVWLLTEMEKEKASRVRRSTDIPDIQEVMTPTSRGASASDNNIPLSEKTVNKITESASEYNFRAALQSATSFEDIQAVFAVKFPLVIKVPGSTDTTTLSYFKVQTGVTGEIVELRLAGNIAQRQRNGLWRVYEGEAIQENLLGNDFTLDHAIKEMRGMVEGHVPPVIDEAEIRYKQWEASVSKTGSTTMQASRVIDSMLRAGFDRKDFSVKTERSKAGEYGDAVVGGLLSPQIIEKTEELLKSGLSVVWYAMEGRDLPLARIEPGGGWHSAESHKEYAGKPGELTVVNLSGEHRIFKVGQIEDARQWLKPLKETSQVLEGLRQWYLRQGPYGAVTLSRKLAEQGKSDDVESFLDRSFNSGPGRSFWGDRVSAGKAAIDKEIEGINARIAETAAKVESIHAYKNENAMAKYLEDAQVETDFYQNTVIKNLNSLKQFISVKFA